DALTDSVNRITDEARAGDLVIFSFAGHGSRVPEKDSDEKDEVFVLAGFDTKGPGIRERIYDKEIFRWLARLDPQGGSVVFVADSCHSGGISKTVDPRIGQLTYRSLRYVDDETQANPAAGTYYVPRDRGLSRAEAAETTAADELKHLTFLAAVDKTLSSPEIAISGEPTPRGALSYAFARAIEGSADLNADGRVTRRELIDFMRNGVYTLTERKQEPVFAPLARLDEPVFALGTAQSAPPTVKDQGQIATTAPAGANAAATVTPVLASASTDAVRIGVLNGSVPPGNSIGRV